jgi:Fe2+ transport system protein FeoA
MKLIDAPIGKNVKIVDLKGGKGVSSKLRQLGIEPGRIVKILRYAPIGGPVMIDCEGRGIALGRGIASRIQVEVD